MTTWQFNLFFLQQVIKNPITLSNIEHEAHLILSLLEASFKLEHMNGLYLEPNSIRLHTCRPLRHPMTRYYIQPY
jgi:hypothetical protein